MPIPNKPERETEPDPDAARRQELRELVTLCLWHADAMGLAMMGIHLNEALESLKQEAPDKSG